jgi:ABC-type uncharacterized transport system ATPase subunit
VLRGGKVTGEVDPTQETNASLSRLMIGSEPPHCSTRPAWPATVVMAVQGLTLPGRTPSASTCRTSRFEVRAGEIVGVAGVSGNGQQELMAALSGEDPRAPAGSRSGSAGHRAHSPRKRRHEGLHFVPEERLGRGAVPG